jgi:hypothetical protein
MQQKELHIHVIHILKRSWNFRWIFLYELQNIPCDSTRNIGNRNIVWRTFKRIFSSQTYAKHGVEYPDYDHGKRDVEPNKIVTNKRIGFSYL